MPCAEPIRAYKPTSGGALLFKAPNPNKNATTYEALDIPCGYCILCRQEQARQWAVRITHEAQSWEESCFITLTYNEANIPEWGGLQYADLVKFWKRLRKTHGKLRYYAVGEYGDESFRPHYHACLFGHAFTENRIILREKPTLLWTNQEIEECWGLGRVSVGALNFQTAQYTASYIWKKLAKKQQYVRTDEETGELIALEQPRAFMSKNLGREWWDKYHPHTTDHDVVVINGRKQKPPKAYDRWLLEKDAVRHQEIKDNRKANAKEETPRERRARAQNAHARAKKKSKSV